MKTVLPKLLFLLQQVCKCYSLFLLQQVYKCYSIPEKQDHAWESVIEQPLRQVNNRIAVNAGCLSMGMLCNQI